MHACIFPCGGGAHGVASDSRFARRGRGNGAASTLGTRARIDLRRAVGSLARRHEQPRLACEVAYHLLHQRRGGSASLPTCSGARASMLAAGGPAPCSSLASARLLRLPTAVHQRSCLLTQPLPFCSPPPALLSLSPAPRVGHQLPTPASPAGGQRTAQPRPSEPEAEVISVALLVRFALWGAERVSRLRSRLRHGRYAARVTVNHRPRVSG